MTLKQRGKSLPFTFLVFGWDSKMTDSNQRQDKNLFSINFTGEFIRK